jgi:5-oxopent-3-ene-1,2,5-tricarboxylate decarboxylase / 2-hydroxyhepta-2,4-diene-1,7-dioate isomerase
VRALTSRCAPSVKPSPPRRRSVPDHTNTIDPEARDGRTARDVRPEDALSHVAGYAPANDVGVWDLRDCDAGSNLRAKGQDGYTPVGPVLAAGGVDPASLVLRTYVNDALVQDTTGDALLFDAALVIADLSRTSTLEAGDIVVLGTPAGTGVVRPGDVVAVELTGPGGMSSRVTNPVAEADSPLAPYGAMPQASPELAALATGRPARRATSRSSR